MTAFTRDPGSTPEQIRAPRDQEGCNVEASRAADDCGSHLLRRRVENAAGRQGFKARTTVSSFERPLTFRQQASCSPDCPFESMQVIIYDCFDVFNYFRLRSENSRSPKSERIVSFSRVFWNR